jgi:hypothetical protein
VKKLSPKTRSITTIYYESDKVPDGIDLELEFTPVDYFGTYATETETGIKVGYVIQDECAHNPLEDCDGFGIIHHHPRSRYGNRDTEYYSILGLDSYGDEDEGLTPNPDAIMLDLYEHSGCIWSIAGTGMNCRWDTSRHESVWVPDKFLLDEVSGKSPEERAAYLYKTCQDALDMYNAWSSGAVYEVVVQVHDFDGTQISCEYADYCYGSDKAEKSLEEAMK